MRHYIVLTTLGLLVISFVLALCWLCAKPDYEPALTSTVLLATITGLFIDRWLSSRERRHELLFALVHELYMNIRVLGDPLFVSETVAETRPRVYPRLYTATLETVIASAAFIERKDRILFRLLHSWRQRAGEFNRRLEVTELCTFTKPTSDLLLAFRKALISGRVLGITRATLQELSSHLIATYNNVSGIDVTTRLFDDTEDGNNMAPPGHPADLPEAPNH